MKIITYFSGDTPVEGLVVDDDVAAMLMDYRVYDNRGYPVVTIGGKQTTIAKLIMGPPPAGHVIDHIDQNPYNATRANLRFATKSQNAANATRFIKRSRTGYKGVKNYYGDKYLCRININGVEHVKTGFNTAEDAARHYNKLVKQHGVLTPLNEVPE